ncbi:hypothetical protein JCM10908_006835 [Rhodotorula pacifica]|uniref:NDUFA4 family protein n=1 Tax=Rhodotorula pacifica TaxID=1495444 RepID=UPI00316ED3D2
MSAVARMIRRDPSLTPLFVAVGGGVIGALAFAGHYLRNSPDVILRKKTNPTPWDNVNPDKNTKLTSFNPDFWAGRKDLPHPQAIFRTPVDSIETAHTLAATDSQAIASARQQAAANAKQRTMAGFDQEGMKDSTKVEAAFDGKERTVEH